MTSFKLCVNRPKRKAPPLKFNETPPAIAVSKLFTSFLSEVLLSDSIFSETYYYGTHAYNALPYTIPAFVGSGNFVDHVVISIIGPLSETDYCAS